MEAIAADLAKDSIKSLLESIVTSIGKEIALAWGFKDDLKDLQTKLTGLNHLLSGAESNNPVLRDWMKKVVDVAYRAEDVVDEYAYEVLNRKLALRDMAAMRPLRRFKTRVRVFRFSRSSNPVLLRFRMAHKVKSLKESITEVYADARVLGIKPVEVAAATVHPTETEMALQLHREQVDNYEVLVGRDHIKAQIIQQLHQASNNPKRLTVIGVHGMPGVGKTKLCRSAFETTEVKGYFKEQIWICISHDFDYQQLLKGMIEQLGEASTMSNTEAIKGKLQEKLAGKKYLLVLDDVWDTFLKAWEPLRNCLQDSGELKGNTILVTSRSREVLANLKAHGSDPTRRPVDDPDIHELPRLLDTYSWSLFEQKVGTDLLDSTYKVELARKMLTKCGGVPLAIKTLAALLQSRNDVHQWKEIEASSMWKEDAIALPASIKLSFKYLPSVALKKCFIYCAILQEDEIIEKDRLIQLWMAQGFLQHPDDEMEQVGEDYFHVLLNNSLFQDAEFDDLGQVISCKMHDAVHALARMLSRNDVTQEMRHLSISGDIGSMLKHGGKLRTVSVFFIPIKPENFTINTVNNLRVLSLVSVDLEELPDSIGELKHLRYLDISRNGIKSLPDGFTRLCNLQTFRASSEGTITKMLAMFPKGFGNLVKLRHIVDLSGQPAMGIPVGLGMLTCLRTLPPMDATTGWGGRLSELQYLSKLEGTLIIKGLEQVEIEEAEMANLGEKENIKHLGLYWLDNNCNKAMEVAEALQPHSNLACLKISNYQAMTLPQWVTKMVGYDGFPFSNLEYLHIDEFDGLEHLAISLKNLVALKELHIMFSDSVITPPQHLECLVSLQILEVECCTKMENLVADMTALVNLRKVVISHCTNMTCLPVGISNLPRLETLELGPFSPELDVFPFPTNNHDNYEDQSLNGCNKQSKTTTPMMIIKQGTIIKRKFESLVKLSLCGGKMEKVKNLPNQIQHLNQLRSLDINDFNGLEALPEWLGNLSSLHSLALFFLPNLKCLPSEAAMGHLSQLTLLDIYRCPLLEEACDKETGTEWSKIQHVPDLRIQ